VATDGYHHGALHEAIMAAAIGEAGRHGPQAIGVRALAKAVGVSPSAVYRHVPSIDALIAEVSQAARERLAVMMVEQRERVPSHRTRAVRAAARFRAVGRAYIDFALTEPQLFDTAFVPTSATPRRPDEPSAWQVLVDGVQELVDAGVLRADAATDAALIAWSGVHGIASIQRRALMVEAVADDHAIEVVLDSIRRSLQTM
jgi:AcrR family transcriptional regulator